MWTVAFLDTSVEATLESLPKDVWASFQRIVPLIRVDGLERVHEPDVKHLEGKLWEMRLKGKAGIARAMSVTAVGKREDDAGYASVDAFCGINGDAASDSV